MEISQDLQLAYLYRKLSKVEAEAETIRSIINDIKLKSAVLKPIPATEEVKQAIVEAMKSGPIVGRIESKPNISEQLMLMTLGDFKACFNGMREKSGLTFADLALRTSFSAGHLAKWARGERDSIATAMRLAEAFNVHLVDLPTINETVEDEVVENSSDR